MTSLPTNKLYVIAVGSRGAGGAAAAGRHSTPSRWQKNELINVLKMFVCCIYNMYGLIQFINNQ